MQLQIIFSCCSATQLYKTITGIGFFLYVTVQSIFLRVFYQRDCLELLLDLVFSPQRDFSVL